MEDDMYRTMEDFREDYAYEREATGKILAALTDASLGQRVSAGGRTLGQLAWHVVGTLYEMPGQAGLETGGGKVDAPIPGRAAEIAAAYDAAAAAVAAAVASQWSDAALAEEIPMYGESWKRGKVLAALIKHEAHHRGQMTVLMRQAGLPVPGVYGPAKEEWAAYGMKAPE
jgi:uncharacterized damage-inducible protein DinB